MWGDLFVEMLNAGADARLCVKTFRLQKELPTKLLNTGLDESICVKAFHVPKDSKA